jgi:opacity protein-like surface antigen
MRFSPIICLLTFSALFAGVIPLTNAAELALKSIGDSGDIMTPKRKYGPYVGVSAGASLNQQGNVRIGSRTLPLNDMDGSAIFSVEVGKSWRMKRWPIQTSLEFEGTFMSTNLSGTSPTAGLAAADVAQYEADMNSMFFMLNGSFALDLYRYRARLGKVLAGFRPYVGGGLGGGQVWYRNATARSADQMGGGTVAPNETPFAIDEFINAWNWYAGLEWTWQDKYSVFAEYRDFHYGDLDNLTNFSTAGYLVGFRFRY